MKLDKDEIDALVFHHCNSILAALRHQNPPSLRTLKRCREYLNKAITFSETRKDTETTK